MTAAGTVLNNRFRLELLLGNGGMGSVFRAVQLATGRPCAIKVLRPELSSDENLVARFRREGLVMCQLANAHTVTLFDFDQTSDGVWYIAMELLQGRSLHAVLAHEGRIAWQRAFAILRATCASLAEAHHHGIIHRDLKPENIYLEPVAGDAEFVKVLDFGIARKIGGTALTLLGQTLGTPDYMSPEQLAGSTLDHRTDIYALGVIAYQLVTGRLPYPGLHGPVQLMSAQIQGPPPHPSALVNDPSFGPAADAVIMRCLADRREDRFASVEELGQMIDQALATPTAPPSPPPPTSRRSGLVIAGVAITCIAVGAVVLALTR